MSANRIGIGKIMPDLLRFPKEKFLAVETSEGGSYFAIAETDTECVWSLFDRGMHEKRSGYISSVGKAIEIIQGKYHDDAVSLGNAGIRRGIKEKGLWLIHTITNGGGVALDPMVFYWRYARPVRYLISEGRELTAEADPGSGRYFASVHMDEDFPRVHKHYDKSEMAFSSVDYIIRLRKRLTREGLVPNVLLERPYTPAECLEKDLCLLDGDELTQVFVLKKIMDEYAVDFAGTAYHAAKALKEAGAWVYQGRLMQEQPSGALAKVDPGSNTGRSILQAVASLSAGVVNAGFMELSEHEERHRKVREVGEVLRKRAGGG